MWFWNRKSEPILPQEEPKAAPPPFDTRGLDPLLAHIKSETGVDLFGKHAIIETKIRLFCERHHLYSFGTLLERLPFEPSLKQALLDLVTVNETYFYREEEQLQMAVDFAVQHTSGVRILCAPCASGEEVYSLAMMLYAKNRMPSTFCVTGIDINQEAIEKAIEGVYSERSLHKLSQQTKEHYFAPFEKGYRVKKEYFSCIHFHRLNIFEERFMELGSFDIIFSRNMLIYFDDAFRLKTIERFASLLKPSGRLFLGHADLIPPNPYFDKQCEGRLSYYTKR